MLISLRGFMLIVCRRDNRTNSKGKEDTLMEAVGLESESVENGPDTDGPGGPDTQQDGNFEGNY
jgi:hypothetical protein